MIYPPITVIRQKVIVRKLRASGAVSEEKAKTLAEAGVLNPNAFARITERMIKKGTIKKTSNGKYYI